MEPLLLSPLRLRSIEFVNRIVVSPMCQYSAEPGGRPGEWHLVHIGSYALSGPGAIIMEATAVEERGRISHYCTGLWSDDQIANYARIIAFARKYGEAQIGLQLGHAGRKASCDPPSAGGRDIDLEKGGWQTIGPCAEPYPGRRAPTPMTRDDMATVKQSFIQAARRADEAGFDLIELHCAHGYLLNEFLSPLSNLRDDDYGGSLPNRMRYPLEVFKAMRSAWPSGKVLGVRISATDWAPGGWDTGDSVIFAAELAKLGCDYICTSSGGVVPEQTIKVGRGYQVPFADAVRKGANIPTMAVGMIEDARQAEDILSAGSADFVAMARGMLNNPRWAWHAAEQLGGRAPFPIPYGRARPWMSARRP